MLLRQLTAELDCTVLQVVRASYRVIDCMEPEDIRDYQNLEGGRTSRYLRKVTRNKAFSFCDSCHA